MLRSGLESSSSPLSASPSPSPSPSPPQPHSHPHASSSSPLSSLSGFRGVLASAVLLANATSCTCCCDMI